MSKKHNPISEYELKEDILRRPIKFKTIQKVDENNERTFVRNFPAESPQGTIKTANIVDKPEKTNWQIKTSHIVDVRQEQQKFIKENYIPATTAGSFCVISGTFTILKDPHAKVVLFPLDPVNPNIPVKRCEFIGNMSNTSTIIGSVDATTWVGYATMSGTITPPFY